MSPTARSRFAARVILIAIAGAGAPALAQETGDGKMSLEELRLERAQRVRRQRRIIANNDGCDCLYFPRDREPTVANLLALRTTALAGTQVDTIAYCTISSGFSNFTHNTKVGSVLARSAAEFGIAPDKRNIAGELIRQGTDPLRAVIRFGHEHGMEVFWSMRMNDTHDVAHTPEKPYFLYPKLKVDHPEWLVGSHLKPTPYGRWSSVDYGRPEIRDLALKFIDEVCRNYDVDGVELDFFRHLCYFKSVATGGKASQQELDEMTELVGRVRRMTDEVGCARARPILVAVRVPDSVGYCRDMGFDIERWLQKGLVDLLVTTGYFRLNPWRVSTELGHRYGVPVYPCLSDSRVRGESRFRRSSIEGYRGRAMNAWAAGADGIHLFNYFNPNAALWRELGDPDTLRTLSKLYFVTARDGNPNRFLAEGDRYRTVPVLTPARPACLAAGRPLVTSLPVGDDLAAARQAGYEATVTLHLDVPLVRRPQQLIVKLNDKALSGGKSADGWLDYPVPAALIRQGENTVSVALESDPSPTDDWTMVYDGTALPARPWSADAGSPRTRVEQADGALLIADRGTVAGDYQYYRYQWGADPSTETVVEARVKVTSGSSYLIMTNGVAGERLGLWPDHIDLYHHRPLRYEMDTTDDFHVYRIVIKGTDLTVDVDGVRRIDAAGTFTPRAGYPRNELGFGAANSGMVGEAYWDYVKARTGSLSCHDVVVSISYKQP